MCLQKNYVKYCKTNIKNKVNNKDLWTLKNSYTLTKAKHVSPDPKDENWCEEDDCQMCTVDVDLKITRDFVLRGKQSITYQSLTELSYIHTPTRWDEEEDFKSI